MDFFYEFMTSNSKDNLERISISSIILSRNVFIEKLIKNKNKKPLNTSKTLYSDSCIFFLHLVTRLKASLTSIYIQVYFSLTGPLPSTYITMSSWPTVRHSIAIMYDIYVFVFSSTYR